MNNEIKDLTLSDLKRVFRHIQQHHAQAVALKDKEAEQNAAWLSHQLQLELHRRGNK